MFDKNAQRLRAEQFALEQLAKGVKAPVIPPMPPAPVYPTAGYSLPKVPKVPKTRVPKVKKTSYQVVGAQNHLGQVLTPGMKVLTVTTGYSHRTHVRQGVFLGAKIDSNGKPRSFSVRVPSSKSVSFIKGTNEPCKWNHPQREYRTVKYDRIATIPSRRVYAII